MKARSGLCDDGRLGAEAARRVEPGEAHLLRSISPHTSAACACEPNRSLVELGDLVADQVLSLVLTIAFPEGKEGAGLERMDSLDYKRLEYSTFGTLRSKGEDGKGTIPHGRRTKAQRARSQDRGEAQVLEPLGATDPGARGAEAPNGVGRRGVA